MTSTKYMTHFEDCGVAAAKAVIASERGLGDLFQKAVRQLLTEYQGKDKKEILVAYGVAIEALEEKAKELLVAEFGETFHGKNTTLTNCMPSFRNYKSSYKALLNKLGAEALTLEKLSIGYIKQWMADQDKQDNKDDQTNKGPGTDASANGGSGSTETDTGSAGGSTKGSSLPKAVQQKVDNALKALAKMDEQEALRIAQNFEAAAWKVARIGNRKMATTTKDAA